MEPAEIWTLVGLVIAVIIVVVVCVVVIYCCCCRNKKANDNRIVSSNKYKYPQSASVSVNNRYPPPDSVYVHKLSEAYDKCSVSNNNRFPQHVSVPSNNNRYPQPVSVPSNNNRWYLQPVSVPSNNNRYTQPVSVPSNNNRYTQPVSVPSNNNRYAQPVSTNRYPQPVSAYVHKQPEYTVGNKFMNKHVATMWEMPSKNRKKFADDKATENYAHSLPELYSIIVVEDEETFRQMIVDEARRNSYGQSPFTTDETFEVVNFCLNDFDHYNFDEEGEARLVLGFNEYNEINHIDSVEFVY